MAEARGFSAQFGKYEVMCYYSQPLMKTKIKDITPCFKFSKYEPYFSAKTDYCSEGLARLPREIILQDFLAKPIPMP
jgi:hypothetical protein